MPRATQKPSFFAILPAPVRYDTSLSPLAKLLYSELAATTTPSGRSFASSAYLAKTFGVEVERVKAEVRSLIAAGYACLQDRENGNGREVVLSRWVFSDKERKILPLESPLKKKEIRYIGNFVGNPEKNPKKPTRQGFMETIPPTIPTKKLVQAWNSVAKEQSLPLWKTVTPKREKLLQKRVTEHPDFAWWDHIFKGIREHTKYRGAPWLSLDYLIKNDTTAVKLSEDLHRLPVGEAPEASSDAVRLSGNSKR